jgi:hypothetical protein
VNTKTSMINMPSFKQPPYRFVPLEDIFEQSSEVKWLIEDYIPKQSIGMLYGPSGVGKSHIVLDMAVRIANGIPWCDNETEQGVVLVMAGEGNSGLGRRLKSIEKRHGIKIDEGHLFFSERAVGIDTEKGFNELIEAIEALVTKPDLIIVDTLSRHLMSSSENNNEDMANFINKLEQIKQRYDTTVLIVHHTGKNVNNGSRGASSIRANIDFSFKLSSFTIAGHSIIDLECEKQKDASDKVPDLSFGIVTVELDEFDSKGRQIKGACAHACKVTADTEDNAYKDIALDSFASDKSEWQKKFLTMVDEELDAKVAPDTVKKKFRALVKELIELELVEQVGKGKFKLRD